MRMHSSNNATKALIGRRTVLAAGLAAGIGTIRPAQAETYPDRPIRIVVAFSPGGEPDILIRAMAPAMQEALGQPVIVDNRPGATTIIAAEHVSQARPDGYTFLLTSSTTFAVTPHLFDRLPYRLGQFKPKLPVRSVAGLVDYARSSEIRSPSPPPTVARWRISPVKG